MVCKSKMILSVALIATLMSFAQAGDLALIRIDNQEQNGLASAILGNAYGRVGDRYLIAADSAQMNDLTRAGINVVVVFPDADPTATQMLLVPDSPALATGVSLAQLGRTIPLGYGVHLAQMSRVASSLLSSTAGYKVVPLEEMSVGFHFNPPVVAAPPHQLASFPTDSLASLVSQDSVYSFNKRLEDFYTRYIWTDSIDRARDWMVQKFEAWGYTDVTTPSLSWGGGTHYNVKAVKPGYVDPDQVIVIGGHYDAVTYNQPLPTTVYAPGADDDGSGTALTLELARILADVPLRKTVIFMPFTAEEVGLVGSRDAARDFRETGTNLEVMFNFDMVGYTGGAPFNLNLQAGSMDLYLQLTQAAAARVSTLNTIHASLGGSSDHASFHNQGFYIVNAIESNFNYPGWHTQLDLTTQMDFPYFTEVVKMAIASLTLIAESPSPAVVDNIVDMGDGQRLEVSWSHCYLGDSHMVYRGVSPGLYVDSVLVGPGQCSLLFDGLAEGVRQYFLVIGIASNGYRSVYGVEGSEEPLVYPRSPQDVAAIPDSTTILVQWEESREADFAFYNIYRRLIDLADWPLYRSNVNMNELLDSSVVSGIPYSYHVTAVDEDGHESEPSEVVTTYLASFDAGPGIIDAFSEESQYVPTQSEQVAFFDSLMSDHPYGLVVVEGMYDAVTNPDVGRFSSLIWIDDDLTRKTLNNSTEVINWYTSHHTNMMISGYNTIIDWTLSPIPLDHPLSEQFMIADYSYWGTPDFVGAEGVNGWPSVAIDPSRGLDEWPNIPALEPRPGATVIYTYDSFIDWPDFEGKPVGLAYDGPLGKRVFLSFPLYYLTPASSQALMAKLLTYFDEVAVSSANGDLNNDGIVDIGDLTSLIDYLFISLQPPTNLNAADVDGSCFVDLGDLTAMIAYLFLDGSDLLPGCVE